MALLPRRSPTRRIDSDARPSASTSSMAAATMTAQMPVRTRTSAAYPGDLREQVRGSVLTPGDAGYGEAIAAWRM